jgi:site-specific DNA recombinase
MSVNPPHALIPYMRKSSGEDPAGSLARQRAAIHRWAEANGVELAPEVWEPNVSGKKSWKERGLGEALDAVRRGEAAGIVCEEQSRLSRENMLATAEVWEAFEQSGARLVCTAEGIDTATGDHELSFAIRAALAREQWKQYARRMADVKAAKVRDGILPGPLPVGYRKRADGRAEVDPATAPAIRELYERRATGQGAESLARFLDERVPKAKGRWSRQAVTFILKNKLYGTGRLHYGDLVSEWEAGAIVDEPLWLAVQRAPAPPRPRSPRWLLTGLAVCGSCGSCLEPHTSRPGGSGTKPYRYMRCMNRSCDARRGASVAKLERWVTQTLWQMLGSRTIEPREAPDLGPLVEAVARADRRLEQVLAPDARDALGDLWAADVKARRAELEEAQAALGEARAATNEDEAAGIIDLRERWDDLDPGERRERLRRYAIERVIVKGPSPADWELMFR